MQRIKWLSLLIIGVILLSGCSVSPEFDLQAKKQEIEEYNRLVDSTLEAYKDSRTFAELNKEDLIEYLTKDTEWGLLPSENKPNTMTEEELKAFRVHGVIHDEYFTSLGATSVREVIILSGMGYNLFATILWDEDEIISISREIKKL